MTSKAIPEMLDMGSSSKGPIQPSHLSPEHPQSENERAYTKKQKSNEESTNHPSISAQKEKIRILLHQSIEDVLQERRLTSSYDVYYKSEESLCRSKSSEQSHLADHIQQKLDLHFYLVVKPQIMSSLNDKNLRASLSTYLDSYRNWLGKLQLLSKLFLFLDCVYLKKHSLRKRILEYGVSLFVDELLDSSLSNEEIPQATLNKYKYLLHKGREFEDLGDIALASDFSKMLIQLNFKKQIKLRYDLINLILSHYQLLKTCWLQDPETYMHIVLSKTSKEITFYKDSGFDNNFLKDLFRGLKWTLVFSDFGMIVKNCLPFLIKDENKTQLNLIYTYSGDALEDYNLDAMALFSHEWGEYIFAELSNLVEEFEEKGKHENIVIPVVNLYSIFENITETRLKRNEALDFEIRRSFQKVFNEKQANKVILVQLSKYCDNFLKNYSKKSPREDVSYVTFDKFLRDVMIILKALNNKSTFVTIYKKDLSKRLLISKSSNINMEKKVVDTFLELVGDNDEINALQIMLRDIEISREKFTLLPIYPDAQFSALILEKKVWPEIPKSDDKITLPPIFAGTLSKFTKLYHEQEQRNKNRLLDWENYALHQVVISAQFDAGEKELHVNLLQATVLLAFLEKDFYEFEDLKRTLNISDKLLKKVLASFTTERYPVLLKEESLYVFNRKLSEKAKRIKLPLSRDKDSTSSTHENTNMLVQKNRSVEFRSAIIRAIKPVKKISFAELLKQTFDMVSVRELCDIADLKTNLEWLIENDYIKREAGGDTLTYLP